MEEEWIPVEGFPHYQVSNWGRVYNVDSGRYLVPGFSSEGILRVMLYRNGSGQVKYVHLLVAEAFHPEFHGEMMTWFDNNRSNNRADNIVPKSKMPVHHRENRREGWGRRVRIVQTGEVFRTVGDCARHIEGDFSKVYAVLRGKRQTHLGFTFEWYEEMN